VTASAQGIEPHDRVTDMELGAWPLPFFEPLHTADEDVGTQPPDVASERGDGAVGRHEQREDVEAIEPFPCFEPGVRARCSLDEPEGCRARPRMAVDPRAAVGIQRAAQTEQPVLAPRRTHSFRPAHAYHAVTGNPVWSNECCG